jgi:hypothetical protein
MPYILVGDSAAKVQFLPGLYNGPKPPGVPVVCPQLIALLAQFNKLLDSVQVSGFAACLSNGEIDSTIGDQSFASWGGVLGINEFSKQAKPILGKLSHIIFDGKPAIAQAPYQWGAHQTMFGSIAKSTQEVVETNRF